MITRRAPRTLHHADAVQNLDEPATAPPLTVTDDLRRAVAAYIRGVREHGELSALARQHGELIESTDADVLDQDALDQLLDPMGGTEQRFRLFHRLLTVGDRKRRIDDLLAQRINDEHQMRVLYDATCGWGERVQALLDDEAVTAITIVGTTAIGEGATGRVVCPNAYASAHEFLQRAEFLVLAAGVEWNRSSPTVVLQLRRGTRILFIREPQVRPSGDDAPGLLVVIQRGHVQPWTLTGLVEHELLDQPAATLLATLLHAGCSFIVSGRPATGKAAVLEALLNSLSSDRHTILIDNTAHTVRFDAGSIVTRFQLGDTNGVAALRASLEVPGKALAIDIIDSSAAALALQQAETGLQALVTIAAHAPEAALRRFARLATLTSEGSVVQHPNETLYILASQFPIAIHTAFSSHLWRRYIRAVVLVAGCDASGQSILVPLIEASVGDAHITWTCHAEVQEHALRWHDKTITTPSGIAAALADLPDHVWEQLATDPLARPRPPVLDNASHEIDRLLHQARVALRDNMWPDVIAFLTAAAQLRTDQPVIDLIDQVLARPDFAERVDREIAETVQAIQMAADGWNLDRAQMIIDQPPSNVLVARRRADDPGWQQTTAHVHMLQDEIAACQAALQQASAYRHDGDIAQALAAIRAITPQHVPPDLARTLLTARRSLLTQIISQTQDEPEVQQEYVTELEQVNRALTPSDRRRNAQALEQVGLRQATNIAQPVAAPPATDPRGEPSEPVAVRTSGEHAETSAGATEEASAQPVRTGWLDAALAHNRERLRLQQESQDATE